MKYFYLFITSIFLLACGGDIDSSDTENNAISANVTAVTVEGNENNYTFNVTLKSDETGCDQYADWWEILSEDGKLIYRRVLGHSHPSEQPFTRSNNSITDPIEIMEDNIVYIRAHMNPNGYSGDIFKGSVRNGFIKVDNTLEFSSEIEYEQPLPTGCTH